MAVVLIGPEESVKTLAGVEGSRSVGVATPNPTGGKRRAC